MKSRSITQLPKIVESLPNPDRSLFNRVYRYYVKVGTLKLPKQIENWAISKFGECREQTIVRVTNRITLESFLFNELRARRPMDISEDYSLDVEDVHDKDKIADFIDVAYRWFRKANEVDNKAIYSFFMWNCLWRAGASVIHGHAQILISHEPYVMQEFYARIKKEYEEHYNSDYFDDIYGIHKSLGLAFTNNSVKILAYLTPIKEKEIFMISDDLFKLPDALSLVLE